MTNDYIHSSGNDCIHIARAEIRPVGTFSNKVGSNLLGCMTYIISPHMKIGFGLTATNNDL
jgi:hypothetical protein